MPHMLSYTDASVKSFVLCAYLGVEVEARKQLRKGLRLGTGPRGWEKWIIGKTKVKEWNSEV